MIIAQGGAFAGWCMYAKDGIPKYCYNLLGLKRFTIEGDQPLPPGDHQVRAEFDYDGGGLAKGATVTLYVDGDKVGDGRLDATVPMIFSGDETTDVGRDTGTGVSDEYAAGENEFTGTVHWVQIDIDDKRRRLRPPDHPRGTLADRDGTPVGADSLARVAARSVSADPQAVRFGDRVLTRAHAELAVHRLRVCPHGVHRHVQLVPDLRRREPRLEVTKHDQLAAGQRVDERHLCRGLGQRDNALAATRAPRWRSHRAVPSARAPPAEERVETAPRRSRR